MRFALNTFAVAFSMLLVLQLSSSCTKTKIEKETVTIKDTILAASIDTTFAMDVNSWNAFNHTTRSLIASGPSTYLNTAEGIKAFSQSFRMGIRLQTKTEVGFKNKNVYYKWKANSGGQFASVAPQIKYDPTTTDDASIPQGFHWITYNLFSTFDNILLLQNDTWYYTRAAFQQNTDNYQVITSTGNYDNKGGTIINTVQKTVYTKSGFPGIRLVDTYASSNAYLILGEFKISGN